MAVSVTAASFSVLTLLVFRQNFSFGRTLGATSRSNFSFGRSFEEGESVQLIVDRVTTLTTDAPKPEILWKVLRGFSRRTCGEQKGALDLRLGSSTNERGVPQWMGAQAAPTKRAKFGHEPISEEGRLLKVHLQLDSRHSLWDIV